MSDHAIIDDVDEREFRDPLDLALDWAGAEALKWLVIGHVAFIVGLGFTLLFRIDNGAVWATPLFALPLLWRGRDHRLMQKVAVLLVGFTAAHWLAAYVSEQAYHDQAIMAGAVAGAIGAGVSLLLLAVFGLMRPGAAAIIFAVFGTLLLAAIGSMGVYLYQTTGSTNSGILGQLLNMLKIYTPWQLVFAYVLAKILRPDG